MQKSSAVRYLDEGHDNKSYDQIMAGLKKELSTTRAALEQEILERVELARKKEQEIAAETAAKTHQAQLAKETELAELIWMLREDLEVNAKFI